MLYKGIVSVYSPTHTKYREWANWQSLPCRSWLNVSNSCALVLMTKGGDREFEYRSRHRSIFGFFSCNIDSIGDRQPVLRKPRNIRNIHTSSINRDSRLSRSLNLHSWSTMTNQTRSQLTKTTVMTPPHITGDMEHIFNLIKVRNRMRSSPSTEPSATRSIRNTFHIHYRHQQPVQKEFFLTEDSVFYAVVKSSH